MLLKKRSVLRKLLLISCLTCLTFYIYLLKYILSNDSDVSTRIDANNPADQSAWSNKKGGLRKFLDDKDELEMQAKLAIVMFGCNRAKYMLRSLEQLFRIRNMTRTRFKRIYNVSSTFHAKYVNLPLIVSMDCHHFATLSALYPLVRNNLISKVYDFGEISNYIKEKHSNVPNHLRAYYRLSKNYQLAFTNIFRDYPNLEQLIVVEDDLDYSDDFLEYFISFSQILMKDESLFCVCAWNDNGSDELLNRDIDSDLLRRTDFFPGLGWLLSKSIWQTELESNWPAAYWDDWIRGQMNGRTCIQPLVSRSETFGRKGASNGQFFDMYLQRIHVSKDYIPFYENIDNYLEQLKYEQFDTRLIDKVYAESVEIEASLFVSYAKKGSFKKKSFRITYYTKYQFKHYANYFGLMDDFKWGIPRGAYKGIVNFRYLGYLVYLAPPPTRKIYIKSWQ